MKTLPLDKVNLVTLNKHHLTENSKVDDILQITNDLCGLHATGTLEPYIQLFIRTKQFKKHDLDRELYKTKSLGRIRGMRKTLFIQTKEMIPIVHSMIKHKTELRDEKYLEIRDISIEEYKMLSNQIISLLKKKELSTSEIKKSLNSKKDIVAIISIMCDQMLLIRGKPLKSWKDRRIYYAPFTKYFPDINISQYNEEDATTLLIEKYIKSYGPVTENDIVWWMGITKSKVRSALKNLESDIQEVKILDLNHQYLIHKSDIEKIYASNLDLEDSINLLPLLDPYLMGYKDRDRYFNLEKYEYVFDRSGNATSSILHNGRIKGIWDITEKPVPTIGIYMFNDVKENLMDHIFSTHLN